MNSYTFAEIFSQESKNAYANFWVREGYSPGQQDGWIGGGAQL